MLHEVRKFPWGILTMPNRTRPRKMTVKKIRAAKRMLLEGVLTNDEIAAQLEISRSAFYKTMPSPRRAVTKNARRPPVWMKQCEALIVQTNLSVRQIAAHLGISRATIYNKFPASRIEELRKEKGAIE